MRSLLLLSTLALSALPACGNHDECGGHSHDPACLVCNGAEDPLTPGTIHDAGNGFTIELVSATPTPFVDALNQAVIRVSKDGTLAENVVLDGTETWYPPGGHGSPLRPAFAAGTNPGEYVISSISFVHAGPWELRFRLALDGATGEYFMPVCIEDDGVE